LLHIVLWKWTQPNFRETYTADHVNRMAVSLKENLKGLDHRVVCITDDTQGISSPTDTYPLWRDHDNLANVSGKHLPSCYRRLRLFDPETQVALGIKKGDRIVSLDLDALVVGPLNEVLNRKDRWVGWAVRGLYHPRVFNGSLWQFNAGDLSEIWTSFNANESPRIAAKAGFMGSDQGWISYKISKQPYAFGWGWPYVASYPREVRLMRVLDRRTRLIFFHGAPKPWHDKTQSESPWIKRYWRP
jgi:hypothetical protein